MTEHEKLYPIVGNRFRLRWEQNALQSAKDGSKATLLREPQNKFDPDAVMVWLPYDISDAHVGYIPREEAALLAQIMDEGGTPSLPATYIFPNHVKLTFTLEESEASSSPSEPT